MSHPRRNPTRSKQRRSQAEITANVFWANRRQAEQKVPPGKHARWPSRPLIKGGLNPVMRSIAIEYASLDARAKAVAPGAIRTRMHSPDAHPRLMGLQPMGRMAGTQDILDAAL
jgi:NAD(P)-dependent dehydrogenase (short-subunit alcohol dehydrogenase family)